MGSPAKEIEELLEELDHPAAEEVRELDRLILAKLPQVVHGVKWNSVSYRTSEWFLTFRSHPRTKIEFVLHLGAKVQPESKVQEVYGPNGLLAWKSPDRATVTFADREELKERMPLFLNLIEEWIKHL